MIANWSASPLVSTHCPARVMPTGTTSNSSGSSAPSTLPALTHEMPCSGLRPPKTIATRVLPGVVTGVTSRTPGSLVVFAAGVTGLTLLCVASTGGRYPVCRASDRQSVIGEYTVREDSGGTTGPREGHYAARPMSPDPVIDSLAAAVDGRPDDLPLRLHLAALLLDAERTAEAIAQIGQALARDPGSGAAQALMQRALGGGAAPPAPTPPPAGSGRPRSGRRPGRREPRRGRIHSPPTSRELDDVRAPRFARPATSRSRSPARPTGCTKWRSRDPTG